MRLSKAMLCTDEALASQTDATQAHLHSYTVQLILWKRLTHHLPSSSLPNNAYSCTTGHSYLGHSSHYPGRTGDYRFLILIIIIIIFFILVSQYYYLTPSPSHPFNSHLFIPSPLDPLTHLSPHSFTPSPPHSFTPIPHTRLPPHSCTPSLLHPSLVPLTLYPLITSLIYPWALVDI